MPKKRKASSSKTAAPANPKVASGSSLMRRVPWFKLGLVALVLAVSWTVYLDARIRHRFEGKTWKLPAQVYARPLEIYAGKALSRENLLNELKLLNYNSLASVARPGTYTYSGNRVTIYVRSRRKGQEQWPAQLIRFDIQGDQVANLQMFHQPYDDIVELEPMKIGGIYPGVREERTLLGLQQVPEALQDALIATEDRGFYHHWGIAPLSLVRAMWVNLRAGRVVQGGSTLTQQLIKNLFLTPKRSLLRKLNEAAMALLLEQHYSKKQILQAYINEIYLGQSGKTSVHGFGMASLFYFGQPLWQCSVEQLALMVGLIKGPSYYDPRRHPERALKRRNLVLDLMQQEGKLPADQAARLKKRPLGVIAKPVFRSDRFPAYMELVKRQLAEEYSEEDLRTEGLKIMTALDPQVQIQLEQSVSRRLPALESAYHVQNLQTGAVVTSSGTGEVLAIVGGRDVDYAGFNRALDARRPIGSLIKPAVYLAALRQPEKYNLMTPIKDEYFQVKFQNGDIWEPGNFDNRPHGRIPLYQGLVHSYNLATARLGLDLGLDEVISNLHDLGVEDVNNPYPSLLLGALSLSPFQVSTMYQTIAANGFRMPLRAIRQVYDAKGHLLKRYGFEIEQQVPPQAAYLLQTAMSKVMQSGTGKSAYRRLSPLLTTAGKTGTTNEGRDSWFAGFSGDYLAVFWLGRDDNKGGRLTGASGALSLWTEFMLHLPQYPLVLDPPADIEFKPMTLTSDGPVVVPSSCDNVEKLPLWKQSKLSELERCP